jgi:hypothetical protein
MTVFEIEKKVLQKAFSKIILFFILVMSKFRGDPPMLQNLISRYNKLDFYPGNNGSPIA